MKKVVIGISSGIAAYKVIEIIKNLKTKGLDVEVIMTHHASEMVNPSFFEEVSGHKVHIDLFPSGFNYKDIVEKREVEHIKLADSASVFLIIPATANIISKIAGGIADDFLTTTVLAITCPVLVFPSMNVHMWENQIIQENIVKLKKHGFIIVAPDAGLLACGYSGTGRLPKSGKIVQEVLTVLEKGSRLKGKNILVTGGATSEPIDAVRVLSNRASGKMGAAIAEACYRAGAEVTFMHPESSVPVNSGVKEVIFHTSKELEMMIKNSIRRSSGKS